MSVKKHISLKGLIIALCAITQIGYAQPTNDICNFATFIPSVDGYCSEVGEYSNFGAQADPPIDNFCFLNFDNTIWFSFIPQEPSVLIRILPNTLDQPRVAVYSGTCGDLTIEGCSTASTNSDVQLTLSDLVIGQVYYLTVDSSPEQTGSFQLCIDDFLGAPVPEADCSTGSILCDTSPFFVESLVGVGLDDDEISDTDCISVEFASVWYKWTCKDPGTLSFTLTPNNYNGDPLIESDDLDFSVYRLNNGIEDCDNKSLVRCMGSGANLFNNVVDPIEDWFECNGLTGLSLTDNDLSETGGCQDGDNNFARALNMQAGESYALIINNYSNSGLGFGIEFGGTATFLGPEVDFDIQALDLVECDKTVNFNNLSASETDSIIAYQWNFGNGATPIFSNEEGPHSVIYDSFGDKMVALTVESTKGCRVTKVLDLEVAACCKDTSTLMSDAEGMDLLCFGIPDGSILAEGINGAPAYDYSIDGINFQPSALFSGLDIGQYEVTVRDRKGCESTTIQIIDQPEEIIANAGIDTTLDFGLSVQLNGSYTPSSPNSNVLWAPNDSIDCETCLDPIVVPFGVTTYTLLVTDENGCTDTDQVTINVRIKRPVYAPNIFSPNKDGNNDFFGLFAGPGASSIDVLYIYDRWGNQMYGGTDLPLNVYNEGWNGLFKGSKVNPGVYTWMAEVRFIDEMVFTYSGDITVIR